MLICRYCLLELGGKCKWRAWVRRWEVELEEVRLHDTVDFMALCAISFFMW